MALWNPSQALLYQPCEPGLVERLKGHAWSSLSPLTSGIVGSGVRLWPGDGHRIRLLSPSGAYPAPVASGAASGRVLLLMTMWVKDLGTDFAVVSYGWFNSPSSEPGEIQLGINFDTDGNVNVFGNGGGLGWESVPCFSVSPGNVLYTWVLDWQDGWAYVYLSINGGTLNQVGEGDMPHPTGIHPYVGLVTSDTAGEMMFDELVIWQSDNLPSLGQIEAMYQRGLAGKGLDEWSPPFYGRQLACYLPCEGPGYYEGTGDWLAPAGKEYLKNEAWPFQDMGALEPVSGIVGTGMSQLPLYWTCLGGSNNEPFLNQADSLTAMFWWSGVPQPFATPWSFFVGHIWAVGGGPAFGVQANVSASSIVPAIFSNTQYDAPSGVPTPTGAGWFMILVRMEHHPGTGTDLLLSVNGADWVNCGSVPVTALTEYAGDVTGINSPGDAVYDTHMGWDEVALWLNAPKFTAEELDSLYQTGLAGEGLPEVPAPARSGDIPLFVAGHDIASGYLPLVTVGVKDVEGGGGNPSPPEPYPNGLLNAPNAVFYLPMDNTTEAVENIAWDKTNGAFVSSGIVGSGFSTSTDGTEWTTLYKSGGVYPSSSGLTRLTLAFWQRNPRSSGSVRVGWCNGNFDGAQPRDGIGVTQNGTSTATVSAFGAGNTMFWSYFGFQRGSGASFFVYDLLWSGTNQVSGWVSVNGSGWQYFGSNKTVTRPDGLDTTMRFAYKRYGDEGPPLVFDEVVLWKDAPRLTDQQLQNLYSLAGMDRRMDWYTYTYPEKASGTMPLYISGPEQASGELPLYTAGPFVASNTLPLYGVNIGTASGTDSLYTIGSVQTSADLPLYINGVQPEAIVAELPLYTEGVYASTGALPLYIHGLAGANRALFLKTTQGSASGILPLFIYGSESETVHAAWGTLPLYLNNDGSVASLRGSGHFFMKVSALATSGADTISRSLFLKATDNHASGTLGVFLKAPEPAIGTIPLYSRGAGSDLLQGYKSAGCSGALFMQGCIGMAGELPLFTEGFALFGQASGVCPLFAEGYKEIADAMVLFTYGVSGFASGAMPLFTKAIGRSFQSMGLYVHGY